MPSDWLPLPVFYAGQFWFTNLNKLDGKGDKQALPALKMKMTSSQKSHS